MESKTDEMGREKTNTGLQMDRVLNILYAQIDDSVEGAARLMGTCFMFRILEASVSDWNGTKQFRGRWGKIVKNNADLNDFERLKNGQLVDAIVATLDCGENEYQRKKNRDQYVSTIIKLIGGDPGSWQSKIFEPDSLKTMRAAIDSYQQRR